MADSTRTPLVPSPEALKRALHREAARVRGMVRALALASGRKLSLDLEDEPVCLWSVPVIRATPSTLSSVALKSHRRAATVMALLRWSNGFVASLQLGHMRPAPPKGGSPAFRPAWMPVTLTVGSVSLSLRRFKPKLENARNFALLSIPHLRLLALTVPNKSRVELLLIEPGITQLPRRRYSVERLSELVTHKSAALQESIQRSPALLRHRETADGLLYEKKELGMQG